MKINIEIPDELVAAAVAQADASRASGTAGQPLSGGAAPDTVAVRSVAPPSAEEPLSAGAAEQAAGRTEMSPRQVVAFDGGAAPG